MNKNLWKNNKNGKLYEVLNYNILNCTNEQDGQIMYLYRVFSEEVLDSEGNENLLDLKMSLKLSLQNIVYNLNREKLT